MGFRFYKRINFGKGFGLNISNSGISPSVRTKIGSFSTKGFSIRTGIPGVSYRKTTNSRGCVMAFIYLVLGLTIYKML
jgi:hypothetical protein